jgi:hypothetical protein
MGDRKPLWASAVIVALLVAGCGSSGPVATVDPPTPPPVTPAPAPPITVTGATKTGVSKTFTLAGGSYSVAWTVTAPKGGCYFYLYLATKANGPAFETAAGMLTSGGTKKATEDWTGVPAGTYVLQEDRTGLANCTGAWSATLAPR